MLTNTKLPFWAMPGEWPLDAFGYVFLANAVNEVGRAIYPDWTGKEPWPPKPFHPTPFAMASLHEQANRVLAALRKNGGVHPTPPAGFRPKFTPEDWDKGVLLVKERETREAQQREIKKEPFLRFGVVKRNIHHACHAGELVTALRPAEGGKIGEPLPVHAWHTEGEVWQQRFVFCQMNPHPASYFDKRASAPGFHYIFVSRESLDKFIMKVAPKVETPPPTPKAQKDFAGFGTWFHDLVAEWPDVRKMTREEIYPLAKKRFNLAKHDVDAERREIMKKFPEMVRQVWGRKGA